MAPHLLHVGTVIPWLDRQLAAGKRGVLVTLVGVDGSSPRPLGSQMAVTQDGEYIGQISAGCVEGALVSEALECLKTGKNKVVRYGKGSPYIDIILPCGSGIDVFFEVNCHADQIKEIHGRLQERRNIWVSLSLSADDPGCRLEASPSSQKAIAISRNFQRHEDKIYIRYDPPVRLNIYGRGSIVAMLTSLAKSVEMEVHAHSPENDTLELCAQVGAASCVHLRSPESHLAISADAHTAAVLLFHDHDWEPCLLKALLATDCFYIGALGSRRTHAIRLDALRELGVSQTHANRIVGPVGLDINAQSPPEIVLSIIADIIKRMNQAWA